MVTMKLYSLTKFCLNVLCASPRKGREVDNILVGEEDSGVSLRFRLDTKFHLPLIAHVSRMSRHN